MSRFSVMLLVAMFSGAGALRTASQGPVVATAMAGVEGTACSDDEHARFKTIVCEMQETCGCAGITCELEWCAEYTHKWKKEFGACLLRGCDEEK
mmetsp:Transcript_99910/g.215541  ORF Transcript_99910/g.215541 Transcript_99910/m.215541 type:complete len:95 (-) Transcript_99910:50-334(-)